MRMFYSFFGKILIVALGISFLLLPRVGATSTVEEEADVLFVFCGPKKDDALCFLDEAGGLGNHWRNLLAKNGLKSKSVYWPDFVAGDLKNIHCVVLVPPYGLHSFVPSQGAMFGRQPGKMDLAKLRLLREWVEKAGGGLFFGQSMATLVNNFYFLYAIADQFEANILFEKLSDDGTKVQAGTRKSEFYRASPAGPAALTKGCNNVWYPNPTENVGVMPIVANEPWIPLLVTSPTARSEVVQTGVNILDERHRKQGFQEGEFPIAAMRQFGSGRVGYLGINLQYVGFVANELKDDRALVLKGEIKGVPSDLEQLTLNLISWLAECRPLPIALTPLPTIEKTNFVFEKRAYKGVIGAISTYSSGKSTPEEYVLAAKAAGLDYLVFTEELAAMKPGDFDRLREECVRLTDSRFIAFPGLRFEDEFGTKGMAFGFGLMQPSEIMQNEKRQLIMHPPYEGAKGMFGLNIYQKWLLEQSDFDIVATLYDYQNNGMPFYDARNMNGMAVVVEDEGKIVESNLLAYAEDQMNGQRRWPLALSFMHSAEALAKTRYRNVVFAAGYQQLLAMPKNSSFGMNNWVCGDKTWPVSSKRFISSGPDVRLEFSDGDLTGYKGSKVDQILPAASGPFHPDFWNWRLKIAASSAKGLKDIYVYDGLRVIRHIRLADSPQQFEETISLPIERQRYVWVHAIDSEGGEAITGDAGSKTSLMQEVMCGDRNNQLFFSLQRRPDGSEVRLIYGGQCALSDKGPWTGRMMPSGFWVWDKKYGVEQPNFNDGSATDRSPMLNLCPVFLAEGKGMPSLQYGAWNVDLLNSIEGPPHVHPLRVLASPQALVADWVMDGVFPAGSLSTHVWSTIFPVSPSKYLKTDARKTVYRIKPDGISTILWEQKFESLQDIQPDSKSPMYLQAGWLGKNSTSWAISRSGQVQTGAIPVQEKSTFQLSKGDWFGVFGGELGSAFAFVLSDNLTVQFSGNTWTFGFSSPDAGPVPAGTQNDLKLLVIGVNRLEKNPVAIAQQVAQNYGIVGNSAAYQITLQNGKVVKTGFPLVLDAEKNSVQGTLDLEREALPGVLPLRIEHLNDNWTAVWAKKVDNDWVIAPLPHEGGSGYMALDSAAGAFFAGHPVTANDPEVRLDLTKDAEGKWRLEAHNPTEVVKEVSISNTEGFSGFHLEEQVVIAPGATVVLNPSAN